MTQATTDFTVVVPTGTPASHIAKGSAILCRTADLEQMVGTRKAVVAYFEGDIYGSGMTFREKLIHAADRMSRRYPTVALTAFADQSEFKVVGRYDAAAKRLVVEDAATLAQWGVTDATLQEPA